MSEEISSGEVKENIASRKTWVRLIYMVIMAIAWNIAEILFWAVTILQFLLKLFTGRTSTHLDKFGRQLAVYFADTARFETFNTETVPFPFSPWPSADEPAAAAKVPARASDTAAKSRSGGKKRSGGARSAKKPSTEAPADPTAPDAPGATPPGDTD